jgi:putative oxidoreductase
LLVCIFILLSAKTIIHLPRRLQASKWRNDMNGPTRIDLAALLLRIALGVMFIAHALLKYFVFTPAGTVQFFESLGLPGPLAYATIAAELAGGVLLVVGAYTRTVAFALLPILLGAAWAHSGNGWLFTSPNGGWEYPAFLAIAGAVVGLLGGGRFALASHAPAQRAAFRLQRAD